jgi:hypothetical protein
MTGCAELAAALPEHVIVLEALGIRSGILHIFRTVYCSWTMAPGGIWNSNTSSGRLS